MQINNNSEEKGSIRLESYQKTRELGRIIGKKGTIQLMKILDQKPCQYKDLDCKKIIPNTSLNLRIKELQQYDIIKKNYITSNRRETHQYTLTILGMELMRFIRRYENKMNLPLEQQKIVHSNNYNVEF